MSQPDWHVIDSTPIRDLIGQETFRLPDGNRKRVGGDIHHTVDVNPESETFGEVHTTLRLPGLDAMHF